MNDEELKALWQTGERQAPAIDFDRVEKLSRDWQQRIRRRVQADIFLQILATVSGVIACFVYPQLILSALLMIAVCLWYVRELRGLYLMDEAGGRQAREFLDLKIKTFEQFFRRTRFVVYIINPFIVHAFLYGFGSYHSVAGEPDAAFRLIKLIIFYTAFYEVAVFIANELYFKFVYKPAYLELQKMREHLSGV